MITAIDAEPSRPEAAAQAEAPVALRIRNLGKKFVVRRPMRDMIFHPLAVEWMQALRDVTCDIHQGEFFGLLGSNGAGKTTLFKILATLVTPDQGSATVAGFDVVREASQVRHVLTPVIADERSLRWRLSATENLDLFATLYGLPSRAIRARVDEILQIVGLEETGRKLVGRFSSGMKQRLLIGRALIPQPKVLLLDEPTRSLDPVTARGLRNFLRQEICKRLGCTVLLATHSAEEAFELCDRVAVLNHGRIVAVGPTEKLIYEFGDDRYRLWTRTPQHPALEGLIAEELASGAIVRLPDEGGWGRVDIDVPGGMERAARALEFLAARGVVLARFERVRLSLGELIQRVIAKQGDGTNA